MRRTFAILTLIGLSFLLVACGGSAEPEEVEFTIEMTEFSYTPDTINLKVGQAVTFNLVNAGQLEHELMIGQEVAMDNSLPVGYEMDFFEHAGVEPVVMMDMHMDEEGEHEEADHEMAGHEEGEHAHHGFMVAVPHEDSATMTFTVTEDMVGTWEIGCFLQNGAHYFSHMTGTIVIEEA
jgi:plastocyanin